MALVNKIRASRKAVVGSVSDKLNADQNKFYSPHLGQELVGLESEATPSVDLANGFAAVSTALASVGNEAEGTQFTQEESEAGARAAILYSNPAALSGKVKDLKANGVMEGVGLESFSSESLTRIRNYAVVLAMFNARRSSALDKVYPSLELNAEFDKVIITLPRYELIGNQYHDADATNLTDWGRRHINDAYRDSSILTGDSNKLRPVVVTGSNEDLFVAADIAAHKNFESLDGDELKTNYLKAQAETDVNLITLSRAPGAAGASRDTYNDRINDGVKLEEVLVGLGDATNKKSLPIALGGFSQAQFTTMDNSGSTNERFLKMSGVVARIDIKSPAAQAINELKAIADLGYSSIAIQMEVAMDLNLHKGTLKQSMKGWKVVGVYKDASEENFIGDLSAEVAVVKPVFLGFRLGASLSSRTLRLMGKRVDDRDIQKVYQMTAREVITADKAITEDNADGILAAMSETMKLGREIDGLLHFKNEVASMTATLKPGVKVDPEQSQYAGLFYLTSPWCLDEGKIDIIDLVKEQDSRNRTENISVALTSLLADRFQSMVTESGYLNAVETYAQGENLKVTPVVVAGQTLARYIYTSGDARTFGAEGGMVKSEADVVPVTLSEFDNRIIMVPGLEGSSQLGQVFNFGFTLDAPALVYDIQRSDSGATVRHLQMQPFYEFCAVMPLAYSVEITGMADFLRKAAVDLVQNV